MCKIVLWKLSERVIIYKRYTFHQKGEQFKTMRKTQWRTGEKNYGRNKDKTWPCAHFDGFLYKWLLIPFKKSGKKV